MEYMIVKEFNIFRNLDKKGIEHVLKCLEYQIKDYKKGDLVYDYGAPIEFAGIFLEGTGKVSTLNANGDEHNLRFFQKGDLFGECFACVNSTKAFLKVSAQSDCKILFLKLSNLTKDYAANCRYAAQVTINVLNIIANNSLVQMQKEQILSQKKIRDKLLLFMTYTQSGKKEIILPFNRQELADYLGVERSALSREMSKMQAEGLITFQKNKITVANI